jgi:two-component system, OmpR family, sensor histidine kinase KdpD
MERGQLKVFLGYAAGVGKTYAMLEAARQRKADGIDIVIALVETHGSADSEALVRQLEALPRYRDPDTSEVKEAIDMDAVLARHPALVLVDDLDRLNPPGARHPRRFQDIEELLEAGISVYATLNIQNLASLTDIVKQITGFQETDTVPDVLLDQASEIELVDLPPEELLGRMREGKAHIPEHARQTIESLYRKGNLTALRELAMRRAAERVDDQMRDYMQTKAIPGPWPAGERLLVCVSANPLAERLVRATRRLADDLNAPWYAVHVETSGRDRTPQNRERILNSLQLAESLGAQTVILAGWSVASAVAEFSQKNNITKIIAGKPLRPRLVDLVRGSIVDQIMRTSGTVDVYTISGEAQPLRPELIERFMPHPPLKRYLGSFLLVAVAAILGNLAVNYFDATSLVVFYLVAVVAAAIYLGRGPSVVASLLSLAAYELFYVVPRFGVSPRDFQHLLTFGGLVLVGWVISNMTAIARDQVSASQRREAQTAALSRLSRELTEALNLEDVLKVMLQHVSQTFSRELVVFLPENGKLMLRTSTANLQLDADELRAIHWSFEHGEQAGRATTTIPQARLRAVPLATSRGIIGVMGVMPPDPTNYLDPEQRRLMASFTSLCALAIERAILADQASQSQLLQAADRLQKALLNSISHDLRTPLATVTGVLSSLKEASLPNVKEMVVLDAATQVELIDTALDEAERLNRLVANLLDMSRVEAGMLHLKCEPSDVQDMIGATLARLNSRLARRPLYTNIAEDLPLVSLDFVMMIQVMVNLLDNAIKYSPRGTAITVEASRRPEGVMISVADEGLGIPLEDLERVFDKFYRVQRPDGITGTGLGLSICRGIVEAHGGRIWAENRPTGGAIFKLVLPVK